MGYQTKLQNKLFYTNLNLDQRIRKDHILRKINAHIDFDFIYNEVKDKYGFKGSVTRRGSEKSTLKYQKYIKESRIRHWVKEIFLEKIDDERFDNGTKSFKSYHFRSN